MKLTVVVTVDAARLQAALPSVRALPFVSDLDTTGEPGAYTVTFRATTADAARAVRSAIEWYQPVKDSEQSGQATVTA